MRMWLREGAAAVEARDADRELAEAPVAVSG
jgi:hypothetical protein